MKLRPYGALVAGLLVAGCAVEGGFLGSLTGEAWDIDAVAERPLQDDIYLRITQEGYIRLARQELSEFDYGATADFTSKAARVADGERVAPPDVKDLSFHPDYDADIKRASKEIAGYLRSDGAMLRAGEHIAKAQIHYECWVHELSEGPVTPAQTEEIELCRDSYGLEILIILDLANLPDNMVVVLPEDGGEPGGIELTQDGKAVTLDRPFAAAGTGEKFGDLPVTEGEIRDAFAAALAAQPKPPGEYEIFFGKGRTRVTDDEFEVILDVLTDIRSRAAAEVVITGYADAFGDAAYNLALSRTRAGWVEDAIAKELRPDEKVSISATAKGEQDLAVQTSAPDRQNRRVHILVR